jgi:hypothetical protein
VAFASYSVKTNYQGTPAIENSSAVQNTTSKANSAEKAKFNRLRDSNKAPHRQSCVLLDSNSLQCAADTFFGKRIGHGTGLRLSQQVRFVIATVPDPIHTDLALSFDRFSEAISQGAQEAGYIFDHAVLPWPTPEELSEDNNGKNDAANSKLARLERENTPGLLIFRPQSRDDMRKGHLFVLVVGETPTAGIHKEQFLRAIEIICRNSRGGASNPIRIDIIGPSFSGSLYSLRLLEQRAQEVTQPELTFRIRSGTVMSAGAIDEFMKDSLSKDFITFKDTDRYLIDRFVAFAKTDGHEGYKENDIALISEDETALGSLQNEANDHPDVLRLYFPRGISQLRSAYQNDPVLSMGGEDVNVPHSKLKLNLDSTGSDDDSIPAYAGRQTAISQEAVMMGIVTVLRVYHRHFLILRATDPKDLLFLTRFFRSNYPQNRIITMGADQLFPRDINDTVFRGVLSLTNYPLLPRQLTEFEMPRPHRVFASTESAGLFNATLDILQEGDSGLNHGMLPEAPYFEYMPPVFDNVKQQLSAKPMVWLTVMGDDGYWPLSILPPGSPSDRPPSEISGLRPCSTCPQPKFISLKPSPFNQLVIAGLFVFSMAFMYLTWFGDFKSPSMLHQQFAMLTDKSRGNLLCLISVLLTLAFVLLASPFSMGNPASEYNWWLPVVVIAGAIAVAISTVMNVWKRGQLPAAIFLALASAIVSSPLVWLIKTHHSMRESVLLYRMAWLQSGVSPGLPLLLVCAAFFSWAWFNLKSRSLFDLRRPSLPRGIAALPSDDAHDTDEYQQVVTRSRVFWAIVILVCAIVGIQDIDPLSLDGTNFNDLYRLIFVVCLVLIGNSIFIAWCTWKKCRGLLLHLDRTPLRWAFRRIEGFSWKPLWGASGGDVIGAYKPLSRSLEAFKHLQATLSTAQLTYIQNRARLVDDDLKQLRSVLALARNSQADRLRQSHDGLVYRMATLQKNLAVTCSLVWLAVLEKFWEADTRLVTTGKQVHVEGVSALPKTIASPSNPGETGAAAQNPCLEDQTTRLAEEFICLTYLNFIHRVLLRIRWQILAAMSAYVLLLFSVKLYPFEPQGRINGLLILLFLALASVIYAIYAQMHRDATLSHLTKTTPGELGTDFWIRMISIGAVPVFSLLATQVPVLNRFFFLWLKPVFDAVHRS